MSLMTWTALDVLYFKKPAIIGIVNGMITGLVAITPAGKFFFRPPEKQSSDVDPM